MRWFEGTSDSQVVDPALLAVILDAYLRDRSLVKYAGEVVLVSHSWLLDNSNSLLRVLIGKADECRELARLNELPPPTGQDRAHVIDELRTSAFRGHLRDYQVDGVAWMQRLRKMLLGGMLADEMGLGKTVQALAYLASVKERRGPFLIVAPASVVPNWREEISKFLPSLAVDLSLDPGLICETSTIAVLSYQRVRRSLASLRKVKFDTVILDEAQMVKNVIGDN
jgi:SNF2 family DNA or RNA helicase